LCVSPGLRYDLMEPFFLLALSAIGTLILLLVSIAITQLRQISKTQNEQGIAIAELRALLLGVNGTPGLIQRVNDLHKWKNEMVQAEMRDLEDQIAELKGEQRTGPTDRRHQA
jgi:DNA-binding transcriptional MerR regulator